MRRFVFATLVGCAACANPGMPAYRTSRPPALPPVGPPVAATTVRIEMKPLPWWTVAGESEGFILGFDDPATTTTTGKRIGPLRSRDVVLADHVYAAVRCAWQVVPMGESRPCSATTRTEAMTIARDAITEARAELRAHAGNAGADVVGEVRCFAERDTSRSWLWCEGVARTRAANDQRVTATAQLAADRTTANVREPTAPTGHPPAAPIAHDPAAPIDHDPAASIAHAPAAPIDHDPAAPIDHEARIPETRLVLVADASVGMLGNKLIVGSTLALRYRPLELGFYILDLQRDAISPRDHGVVGIGLTALGRIALGRSRADAIVGVSAVAAAVNNTTNPDFDGLYHGFAGIAYQTPWRIAGAAQPFVQLRAGAAYGGVTASRTLPMLELHLGLTSPERR